MRHIMIATHANLAESMIETAKMICGSELVKGIQAFCMTEDKNADDFLLEVKEFIDKDPEGEYFVLTDLFAASPCTTCVRALGKYEYRLVTGLNIGMLIEVLINRDTSTLLELEDKAITAGKEGVNKFYLHV